MVFFVNFNANCPGQRRIQIKFKESMDLQWLLPQQIEQILRLVELSSLQDPALAANILEQHQWDFERALHELVDQNDAIKRQEQQSIQRTAIQQQKAVNRSALLQEQGQDEFQMRPQDYYQLDQPKTQTKRIGFSEGSSNKEILWQQNNEYEQMEKNYHLSKQEIAQKKQQEEQKQIEAASREQIYLQTRKFFEGKKVTVPFCVKFRTAHQTAQYTFDAHDSVATVFEYVSSHLRQSFENSLADYDLTQAFPQLSLKQRQKEKLSSVFEDSTGEVLLVKEL